MTVSELMAILDKCDGEAIVVLSRDAEGNGFSPLSDHSEGLYEATTTWSGEFTTDPSDEGVEAVCLWPTN